MKYICNLLLFVTIFLPLTWTLHVTGLAKNNQKVNGGDYLAEEHTLQQDLQTFNNNYLKYNTDNDVFNNKVNSDGHKRFLTISDTKTNAHQLLPIPRQEKSYDIDDDVVFSANKHTVRVHENLEAQPTSLTERQQQQQKPHNTHNYDVLSELNGEPNKHSELQHTRSRQRRQLSDFFIAPNTRWCGRGNTANGTYNHLGGASMADKCCRTHDHCKFYIPAMSNRYDLFNYRPYTLSHCNCDRRFRTCLKMANDEDANTIGKLFFNLVQTQCFVLTKKEVICQQRAHDGTCLKEHHIKQKAYLRNNKKY